MRIAETLLAFSSAVACATCAAPSSPQLEGWTTLEFLPLSVQMPPGFVQEFSGGCVDQTPTFEADDGRTKVVVEHFSDTEMFELDRDAFAEFEQHMEIVSGKPAEVVHGRLKADPAAESAPVRYVAIVWRGVTPRLSDGRVDCVALQTRSSEPARSADLERIVRSARLKLE